MASIETRTDVFGQDMPREIKGSWWTPGTEDKPIQGTLTFDERRTGTLLVDGILGDAQGGPGYQVLGRSTANGLVTLTNALQAGWSTTMLATGAVERQRWRFETAFLGAHLLAGERSTLSSLVVRTYLLEGWIGSPRPKRLDREDGRLGAYLPVPDDHEASIPGGG